MKKIFSILIFFMITGVSGHVFAQSETELVEICTQISGDATYLKDFRAKLDAGNPPPVAKTTIVLRKSSQYRFAICGSRDYPGEPVLKLYDNNRLLLTTHNVATGEDRPFVDFRCQKTGVYHIFITFKEGKPGLAVSVLSFVKTF